jgi:hypothetical protein
MTKRTKAPGPLFGGGPTIARKRIKYDRRYVGRPPGRVDLYGRACRVLITWRGSHTIRNVLVEFENGERVVVPIRTIRIIKDLA